MSGAPRFQRDDSRRARTQAGSEATRAAVERQLGPSSMPTGRDLVAHSPRMIAKTFGLLFIAGATMGLAAILLPHASDANVGAQVICTVAAYVAGFIAFFLLPSIPRWLFHIGACFGTVLISLAIYWSGNVVSPDAFWYLLVALFTFYFFSRAEAFAQVAFVGLCYGIVLAARSEPLPVARWVITMATMLIAGMTMERLVRRVRAQMWQASEDATALSLVVDAMHGIFRQAAADETRVALCETACRIAHSDYAALWEPTVDRSGMFVSASAGGRCEGERISFGGAPGGVVEAFASGRAVFAADVRDEPGVAHEIGNEAQVASCLWQPVIHENRTVGVLAVYWRTRMPRLFGNVSTVLGLLGAQAALAVERAELLSRLEQTARTDDLTGLPNRRAWQEELPREMERARREHTPLCVAMLDLDGFKALNDSTGHQAGDQLLKQVAGAWSASLRLTDVIARYGGDEFAVVLPNCDLETAHGLVERLMQSTPDEQSSSAGLTEWDGAVDADRLLAQADGALYEAKRAGGNRLVTTDGSQIEIHRP
jgi:diguanylate cyclase (GGDEF)-like protein